MDITLSKIFIPTLDKARALQFLTFIFDCEVLTDQQDINYTLLGNTKLYFLETNSDLLEGMPFCSFAVTDQSDLENIKQKIQFFCYREDLELPSFKLSSDSFEFFDFDGNLWKIELNQPSNSINTPIM